MTDIGGDTAWKARNAANVPPADSFFSENAHLRWQNANLPSDTFFKGDKLSTSMWSAFSFLSWLRMRFSLSSPIICAALFTFCTSLTRLWIDICLALAFNIAFWLYVKYLTDTGRSFGINTSRLIHEKGHQNIAHNSRLWSYLVVKFAIVVSWNSARLAFAIVLQPQDYINTTMLLIITALTIMASIVWLWPHQLVAGTDWLILKGLTIIGLAALFTIGNFIILWRWMSRMLDACTLFMERSWPLEDFAYTALPPRTIRLLEIAPKLPFRGIQARLIIVKLNEAPIYEAISYTWGDCVEKRTILIEGKRFTTTLSAWQALNAHSSVWRSKIVWIDQVCINQADDEEKGQQVAMMFDIYRGADRVVAHLGTSSTAAAAVGMLSELMWQEFQQTDVELAGFLQVVTQFQETTALTTMLQHPWFSRVWIVQEVAAAKELAVAYGGYIVDWESMASALRVLMRPGIRDLIIAHPKNCDPVHLETVMRSITNVLELMSIGNRVRENLAGGRIIEFLKLTPAFSLPWMLGKTTKFMATDPRDKIYALQSMSLPCRLPHGDPVQFEYDYTLSVELLYTKLAVDVLFYFPDPFYLMSFAGLDKPGNLDLPSWVPDWTNSHKWQYGFTSRLEAQDFSLMDVVGDMVSGAKIGTTNTSQTSGAYRAGGSSRPVKLILESEMAFHGVRIDTITNVSKTTSPDMVKDSEQYFDRHGRSMFPKKMKKINAWLREARDMAMEVYDEVEASEDAFWRTLIGDRWQGQRPAPQEAYHAYLAWNHVQACWQWVLAQLDAGIPDVELPQHDLFNEARTYEASWLTAFSSCAAFRSFATVGGKYVAIVPPCTQVGDVVVVPLGARTPWVLRPLDSEGDFQFIGEAYVHGLMDGECITPHIALGAKVLSIYFAEEVKRKRDARNGGERTEPEWVNIMVKNDLILGSYEDIGDTSSIADEDVIHSGSVGGAYVPGCEWFILL